MSIRQGRAFFEISGFKIVTSPNIYSTATLTLLKELLEFVCSCVNWAPLFGANRFLLRRYAGSPKIYSSSPLGPWEYLCSVCKSPDMASIAQSCLLPSTGPNRLAVVPFGVVTNWSFKACNLLCPLYNIRWFTFGLQQGRKVPSINP